MNKLLVAVFDNETTANAGLNALRSLHAAGDITLYAHGVLACDDGGHVSVKQSTDAGPVGTATGMAVGSLIGLLAGPAGVAIGAVTGTLAGALRDFWVAGVGLDFIEAIAAHLQPGKVALVAEIEEEWVIPLDTALEAAGGHVFRRTRSEFAEAQLDHDITTFNSEVKELESELLHASNSTKIQSQAKLAAAKARLDDAINRGQHRIDTLKHEAEAKAESLRLQIDQAAGQAKARIEDRVKRVRSSYHARSAKLSRAWDLTKEALAA